MKRGGTDHPKLELLKVSLGIGHAAAIGHHEALLHFTAKFSPAGDVGKWPNEVIAKRCYWEGDPDAFVNALVDARLVDRNENHRLVTHDWPEHCEDATHMTLARETKLFADGSRPKLSRFNKDDRDKICAAYDRLNAQPRARTRRNAQPRALPSPPIPSPPMPSQIEEGEGDAREALVEATWPPPGTEPPIPLPDDFTPDDTHTEECRKWELDPAEALADFRDWTIRESIRKPRAAWAAEYRASIRRIGRRRQIDRGNGLTRAGPFGAREEGDARAKRNLEILRKGGATT